MKSPEQAGGQPEHQEKEPQELNVHISKNASFAELFSAMDALEEREGLDALRFEEELWDNFDSEIAEEVLAFRNVQESRATTTNVLEFFGRHGYSQDDVSAFLPIKFE